MYLIIAKYDSDAQRKRIEYALEKWKGKVDIIKPEGLVAIVDGKHIKELVEELYSRTLRENVSLYQLENVQLDISETEKEIRMKVVKDRETLEKLLDFIMSKNKAVLKLELTQPLQKIYQVYTKKGKAEIAIGLYETEIGADVRIRITGYGEAVDLIHRKLTDELKPLEEAK